MAKRASKRPTQLEKNDAGCMWAFISLFDFRHGPPTPKLLSDRKPGSSIQDGNSYSKTILDSLGSYEGKYDNANNDMITEAEGVDSSLARVKILMENKLFEEHLEKNLSCEGQSAVSNLGHKFPSKKNLQQRNKRSKVTTSDAHVNNRTGLRRLDDQQSDNITLTGRPSSNFDLIAFLIDLHADRKPYEEMHVNCDNKNDLSLAMKDIIQKMNGQPDEFDSQIDQKEFILCKALAVIFETFDNQKFVGGNFVDKSIQSEEFVDALQILNSNKHVVLKLLEDPNSSFNKLTQDLQKIEVGKLPKVISENHLEKARLLQEDNASSRKGDELENKELFHKQNTHGFFWKRDKSKGPKLSKQSENSETLSRIVVLKPGPAAAQEHLIRSAPSFSPISHHKVKHEEEGTVVVSHFSLREIKRRLKHIIGGSKKERQVISRDGVLHKIPIGYKVSGKKDKLLVTDAVTSSMESRSSHDTEKSSVVFPVAKGKENVVNPEEGELDVSKGFRISVIKPTPLIYEDAKKHLTEMLDNGDQTASIPKARVSKSLGRLLSMPEYMLSPRVCREGDKELVLPSSATSLPSQQFNQEDPTNSVSTLTQDLEISSCSAEHQIDEIALLPLQTDITDTHINEEVCIVSHLNHEGRVQNAESIESFSKLCPDQFDVLQEPNNDESDVAHGICNGDDLLEMDLHSIMESERPRSSLKENLETPASTIIKPGRSSPVAIVEKFISEDFTSPKFRAVHPIIPTVHSRANLKTCFEDIQARVKYVEAVLHASGLSTIDFSERWHLADILLEPSLFDEVETSCSPRIDDPKLLFDCIHEVLEEIQEKHFKSTPWVSLLASTVQQAPVGWNLVKEVNRRIERHIAMCLPITVDDVVTKDLDYGSWMDLQFELDDIVIEIWDTALDDLVEETIFDLWLGLSDDW